MPEVNATSTSTDAADIPSVWLRGELLSIQEKQTVFYDIGEPIDMPEGEGKTIQCNRYERLPLPDEELTEGTTPTATPLTSSTVQAILGQWGQLVSLTDVVLMTSKHPKLQVAKSRLGTSGSELWDREIQRVLMGGANVVFPSPRTARSQIVSGDTFDSALAASLVATLRQLGAPGYDAKGMYLGVVDPYVEQDLLDDTKFVSAHVYQDTSALFNGEVGSWKGIRFKRSNMLPIISLIADDSATYTTAAANIGAAASGETNFAAGTSVPVVVTFLDPVTGFETKVSAVETITDAGTYSGAVSIVAGAASGRYRIYVGLEGSTIATLQTTVTHTVGTADTRTFIKAGVPSAVNRFVTAASGPVAPSVPGGVNVHISYVFGKEAFAVTKLGPRMESVITPAVPSDSDPLKQRRKVGYKTFFKAMILNVDRFRRVETSSDFN
jgi:N4-gp56 family major capsid protein